MDAAGMRSTIAGIGLHNETELLDLLGEFLFGQGAEIDRVEKLLAEARARTGFARSAKSSKGVCQQLKARATTVRKGPAS